MRNAKEEFLNHTEDLQIKCAVVMTENYYFEDEDEEEERLKTEEDFKFILKLNYTEEDYNNFLKNLDFEYNCGYGGQILFGYIWYTDNSWSTRGEYDGSEWWNHHNLLEIPKELL
jgi:hypothetical protein